MSECPFKVGDLVRRTGGSSWSGVEQGGIYKVFYVKTNRIQRTIADQGFWNIYLEGFGNLEFASYKFELVSRERKLSGFGQFVLRVENG